MQKFRTKLNYESMNTIISSIIRRSKHMMVAVFFALVQSPMAHKAVIATSSLKRPEGENGKV